MDRLPSLWREIELCYFLEKLCKAHSRSFHPITHTPLSDFHQNKGGEHAIIKPFLQNVVGLSKEEGSSQL